MYPFSRKKLLLDSRTLHLTLREYQASGAPTAISCQNCAFRCGFVPDRPGKYEVLCGCRTINMVTILQDGSVSIQRKTRRVLDFIPEEFKLAFKKKLSATRGSYNYLISISDYKLRDNSVYEVKGKLSYLTDYDRTRVDELESKIARLEHMRLRMPNFFGEYEEKELKRARESLFRIGLRYTFIASYHPVASSVVNYKAEYQVRDHDLVFSASGR